MSAHPVPPDARMPFAVVRAPTLAFQSEGVLTRFTADDLDERIRTFAARLAADGVPPRALVGLAVPDPLDQVVGFLGAIAADTVPCLLPPLLPPDEDEVWARRGLVLSGPELASATVAGRVRALPDHALFVQRTSGTSGPPGAIVQSRAGVTAFLASAIGLGYNDPSSVTVGWLPLHHDYGLVIQVLLLLAGGGRGVILDAMEWMADPGLLLAVISAEGGTHTAMPAFGFRRTVEKTDPDDRYDLSRCRIVNCASEPIPADLLEAFADRCRPWGLDPGALVAAYGLAEVVAGASSRGTGGGVGVDTVSASALAGGRAVPTTRGRRIVSCGPPLTCLEARIIDPEPPLPAARATIPLAAARATTPLAAARAVDAALPERVLGEIALRGPALGERLTDDGVEALLRTPGGWFRTGDIGYLAGGEIHVVDRVKDLIVTGGVNLHPSNLERIALAATPGVRRAAAFAVFDDATATEHPVLLLERPRAGIADEAAARRAARRALLTAGIPVRDLRVVDRGVIAVTTSGKVRRQVTRQRYLDGIAAEGAGPPAGPADWFDVVRDVTGLDDPDPAATLEDLGIDSLALYEVLAAVETARGAPVDDAGLTPASTLADLLEAFDAAGPTGDAAARSIGARDPRATDGAAAVAPAPPSTTGRRRLRAVDPVRLLRHGPVVGPVGLPLPVGAAVQATAADLAVRRGLHDSTGVGLALDLAAAAGHPDPDEVARISLMVNTWVVWRNRAVRRVLARDRLDGTGDARAGVAVTGASHLAASRGRGRGTILVTVHSSLALTLRALPALAGRDVVAVDARWTTAVDRTRQLRQGRRALAEGGVAVLFVDEFGGSGGITIEVGDRLRPLRPGVARLAADSDADVVPVLPWLDRRGRTTIDVRPSLTGSTEADLLAEVGAVVRDHWHEHPGSLSWYILSRHATLAGTGAPSPAGAPMVVAPGERGAVPLG